MYKRIIIRATFTLCMALFANESFAQGPNNSGTYYQKADGQKGSSLKTALADIISNHTTISYNGLLDAYKTDYQIFYDPKKPEWKPECRP